MAAADREYPAEVTTAAHVLTILDAIKGAGVEAWIGGGWGIDALAGEETRPHADVDVCIPAECEQLARDALEAIGLRLVVDELPTRFLMAATGRGAADIHPIQLFPDGSARLHGPGGIDFEFAPGSLDATGVIGGRPVHCFTADRQRVAHAGYEPRQADLLDLAVLDRLAPSEAGAT